MALLMLIYMSSRTLTIMSLCDQGNVGHASLVFFNPDAKKYVSGLLIVTFVMIVMKAKITIISAWMFRLDTARVA